MEWHDQPSMNFYSTKKPGFSGLDWFSGVKTWRQLTSIRDNEVDGPEERFWVVFLDKLKQNPQKLGLLNLVPLGSKIVGYSMCMRWDTGWSWQGWVCPPRDDCQRQWKGRLSFSSAAGDKVFRRRLRDPWAYFEGHCWCFVDLGWHSSAPSSVLWGSGLHSKMCGP